MIRKHLASATAVLAALFYFVTGLWISAHRLLWFDELLTYFIARLHNADEIVSAISHSDHGIPAPYFLAVHAFLGLFGASPVIARLPSALALSAGLLVVFDCARRLAGGLYGLIAVAVLGCSCLPYYGYEARSYAIYFLFAATALWVYLHGKPGIGSAIGFAAAVFLAVLAHFYAVLVLTPYLAWEAVHWRTRRALSSKLIGGVIGACCAAALLWPQMKVAREISSTFWSPPTIFRLRASFTDFFPDAAFLLAAAVLWMALSFRRGDKGPLQAAGEAETLGWLHLLIPFAGYLAARAVTNAFVSRYFLGVLPGVAVACACWLWRRFRWRPAATCGILALLGGYAFAMQMDTLRHSQAIDPFHQQSDTRGALAIEPILRADGKRYSAITGGMLYLELRFYAQHPDDYILLAPTVKSFTSVNTLRLCSGLGRYYPMRFWTFDDLRLHAAETALVQPSQQDLEMLRAAGFTLARRAVAPIEVDYIQPSISRAP